VSTSAATIHWTNNFVRKFPISHSSPHPGKRDSLWDAGNASETHCQEAGHLSSRLVKRLQARSDRRIGEKSGVTEGANGVTRGKNCRTGSSPNKEERCKGVWGRNIRGDTTPSVGPGEQLPANVEAPATMLPSSPPDQVDESQSVVTSFLLLCVRRGHLMLSLRFPSPAHRASPHADGDIDPITNKLPYARNAAVAASKIIDGGFVLRLFSALRHTVSHSSPGLLPQPTQGRRDARTPVMTQKERARQA